MGDTEIGTPYRMELNISLVLWRGRKRGKGGREGGREEGGEGKNKRMNWAWRFILTMPGLEPRDKLIPSLANSAV